MEKPQLLALILLVAVVTASASMFLARNVLVPSSQQSTSNTTPPPLQTEQVQVTYSYQISDVYGGLQSPGIEFVILTLTVKNSGYPSFHADPDRNVYLVAGGHVYNYSLGNPFFPAIPPTDLSKGQRLTGQMVFQLPSGTNSFQVKWQADAAYSIVIISS